MNEITTLMTEDHRSCDDRFATLEAAVGDGDWPRAATELEHFLEAMNRHFTVEEEQLFPEFERLTGMTMGPTRIMRTEHQQMRGLFEELRAGMANQDADGVLGAAETLNVLMQQHNLKEEEILYPMTDQALGADAETFARKLGAAG